MASEQRTARLTILIDPRKKALFEELCQAEDVTPSQVVRRLIRGYIEDRVGTASMPAESQADARPPRMPRTATRAKQRK